MKGSLLFFILLWLGGIVKAQDRSNKGTEFWLGYGNNILFDHDAPVNHQTLALYLSAEEATDVTVTVNGSSWSRTVHIPANTVDFSIVLPKDGADDCRILEEGLFERGIHLVSSKPIVAYAHQYDTQLSGATMLMPVDTYGYTYYSINYTQPYTPGDPGKCWFYAVASEDHTSLEITPADTTETGKLPGESFTINLNKGELYNVFGKISDYNSVSKDLTGSKIISVPGADGKCHPVAVFSGNSRFIVCNGDGGEIAQQQLFPASAWGTRYLAYHSFNTVSNPLTSSFLNFYRVAVSDPTTVVKRNGVVLTGLQRNFYYEFQSSAGDYIEADKPVMVCQYTPSQNQCAGTSLSPQGDPEMFFLSPIEQGIKKATVYNTRNSNITISYLTVILPNEGIASLRIDGSIVPASSYTVHPANPGYSVVAKRLLGSAAQHTIESDSAFTAMIYGTGFWESYGYIAGTLVNNLNSIGSIRNVYSESTGPDTYTCPRSPVRFSIKLAYRATSLQWLLSQVNGLSSARDTLINDPVPVDSQLVNGRKYFSYMLNGEYSFKDTGTFYIPVNYTSPSIDHCSKTESSSFSVLVQPGPKADFDINYHGCRTDTAFLEAIDDTINFPIRQYAWSFDDGLTDSLKSIRKLFVPGIHPVAFKAIASNGCVGDTIKNITTFSSPVAKFGFDRDICLGDSIHFSDSSAIDEGRIVKWQWRFDDGSSQSFQSNKPVPHLFTDTGFYRVSLTVISEKGCVSDSFLSPVPVFAKPIVGVSFSGRLCVDSSLQFLPVVKENGNAIHRVNWDFGDGQTLPDTVVRQTMHAYNSSLQNIKVNYTATGDGGCISDPVTLTIPNIHTNPIAKFSYTAGSFCPEKDILFTDSSGSAIQSWKWNFGDGDFSAVPPIAHKFQQAGKREVRLVVIDTSGCGSAVFVSPVTIYAAPVIDAGPTITKQPSGVVAINATADNSAAYQYTWTPSTFLNATNVLNPVTSTSTDIVYSLRAVGGPGNCESTDTVAVLIRRELFIPNAFSPNGDGLNDVWNIPSINGNPNAIVTIFNRWGEKVFESKGYRFPWDGKLKGIAQPRGAYYYVIRPNINEDKIVSGSLLLVR